MKKYFRQDGVGLGWNTYNPPHKATLYTRISTVLISRLWWMSNQKEWYFRENWGMEILKVDI